MGLASGQAAEMPDTGDQDQDLGQPITTALHTAEVMAMSAVNF